MAGAESWKIELSGKLSAVAEGWTQAELLRFKVGLSIEAASQNYGSPLCA